MALSYNNTVSSAQNALNKKLNPSPLSLFKAPSTPMTAPQTKIGGSSTPVVKPTASPAKPASTFSGSMSALNPTEQAQYDRVQGRIANPTAPVASAPTTPSTLTPPPVASGQTPSAPKMEAPTAPVAPQAPGLNQSGLIQRAIDLQKQSADFQQKVGQAQLAAETNPNYSLDTGIGRSGAIQKAYGLQGQNLASQAATASSLAGMVSPVSQFGILTNPLTGESISKDMGGLTSAVSSVAEKVKNGQMSYSDALNSLGGYGQAGVNELNKQLPSGFNVAQSNALAGQQGTIVPAFNYAKTALSNLQASVGQLGVGQGTNIPAVNSISDWLSQKTGIGSEQTRAYKAAIAEARNAIQSVLASVRGGTPTDYVSQSMALLPDNATPNDIQAAISTLDTLGSSKVGIYSNPGQVSQGTQPSASGTYSGYSGW